MTILDFVYFVMYIYLHLHKQWKPGVHLYTFLCLGTRLFSLGVVFLCLHVRSHVHVVYSHMITVCMVSLPSHAVYSCSSMFPKNPLKAPMSSGTHIHVHAHPRSYVRMSTDRDGNTSQIKQAHPTMLLITLKNTWIASRRLVS